MRKFFWVVNSICCVAAGFELLAAMVQDSAPKQAAAASVAVGLAVVPYCFARSLDEISAASTKTPEAVQQPQPTVPDA